MQTLNIQLEKSGFDSSSVSVQKPYSQDKSDSSFEKQLEKAINDTSASLSETETVSANPEFGSEVAAVVKSGTGAESDSVFALSAEGDQILRNLTQNTVSEFELELNAEDSVMSAADKKIMSENADKISIKAEVEVNLSGQQSAISDESAELPVETSDENGIADSMCFTDSELILTLQGSQPREADTQTSEGKKTQKNITDTNSDNVFVYALHTDIQNQTTALDISGTEQLTDTNVEGGKEIKLGTGTSLDEKIRITDARSASESGVTEAGLRESNFVTSVSYGEGSADITMNLAGNNAQFRGFEPSVQAGESRFASLLSSELRNNASEFVKSGSIILRDGNAGTINLILHPEELGNVKISLNLHDKIISGHITVSSEDAYNAFKNNIDSIKQAFNASGFETVGFDLSWSGSHAGGGSQHGFNNQSSGNEVLFKHSLYADMIGEGDFSEEASFAQKMYSDSAQIAVNIMA